MMKLPKIYLFILMLCSFGIVKANDSTDFKLVRAFVNNISNDSISYETIIERYICIDTTNTNQQEERIKLIRLPLKGLRKALKGSASWTIERYLSIPLKDQNIIIEKEEKQNIYVLKYGPDFHPCFIWVQNNKIVSCVTMRKGNLRFFLKFCS